MSTTGHPPDDSTASETVLSHLAEHPRVIGALFLFVLLLTQAGEGAAGASNAIAGP